MNYIELIQKFERLVNKQNINVNIISARETVLFGRLREYIITEFLGRIDTLNFQCFLNPDRELELTYKPLKEYFRYKIDLPAEFSYSAYHNLMYLQGKLDKTLSNFYCLYPSDASWDVRISYPTYTLGFLTKEDCTFVQLSGILDFLKV